MLQVLKSYINQGT